MITQEQVQALLHRGPMSFKEIVEELGADPGKVSQVTRAMRHDGTITVQNNCYSLVGANQLEKALPAETELPKEKVSPAPDPTSEKANFKPGIIEFLKAAEARMTFSQIVKGLLGDKSTEREQAHIRIVLQEMVNGGTVRKNQAGYYDLTQHPKIHPRTLQMRKQRAERRKNANKVASEKKIPQPRPAPATKSDPLAAIDRMAQRMRPEIKNAELKRAVLTRLAPILDKEIGDVLEEIAKDLG